MPRFAGYQPGEGAVDVGKLISSLKKGEVVVPIIFYRAMLLAADTAPVDALCAALSERGLIPAALFVTSLKDRDAAEFLRRAFAELAPAVVVTTTAFAAGGNIGGFRVSSAMRSARRSCSDVGGRSTSVGQDTNRSSTGPRLSSSRWQSAQDAIWASAAATSSGDSA